MLIAEDSYEMGLWYRLAPVCFMGGTLFEGPSLPLSRASTSRYNASHISRGSRVRLSRRTSSTVSQGAPRLMVPRR
ncbi:hypothetical protein [Paracoccus mutanolyticus]|uniref:hypothetical protein n=1 Tax=Paracoccus mutanolyticus TaxID=1499308 RepID=UPI0021D5369B|nr:hypothetical protein [Paracoccus mutanolyticus]